MVLVTGVAAGGLWFLRGRLPEGGLQGALLGLGLAAAGAVSWILAAAWSGRQGAQASLLALVLGILGRLVVYGAALVYVALRTSLDPVLMAVSLLGFHVVFLIIEIRYAVEGMRRGGAGAGDGSGHGG